MHPILCFYAVQFNINGNDLIEGGKTLADGLKSNTTITKVRCEYSNQHSVPEAERCSCSFCNPTCQDFPSAMVATAEATTLSTMCIPLAGCYTQFTICSLFFLVH